MKLKVQRGQIKLTFLDILCKFFRFRVRVPREVSKVLVLIEVPDKGSR